jgi:hypothetical protein
MIVTSEATNGIPSPDKPGYWIVPPWRPGASLCDVVRHFLRFHPWSDTNTAGQLAYYKGYQAAIEAASTYELTSPCDWRWYDDLRDCVGRCVAIFEEKRTVEIQAARRAPHHLHVVAPVAQATPERQKKVS